MSESLTGRELDAIIAERLFGWTETKLWGGGACVGVPPDRETVFDVPRYSGGWAGAGLVVDEMRRRGWQLLLHETMAGNWVVGFAPKAGGMGECLTGPDLFATVARAALAAIGASKETTT
jgi:hypothetical protein